MMLQPKQTPFHQHTPHRYNTSWLPPQRDRQRLASRLASDTIRFFFNDPTMPYATIKNDGEATPLQIPEDGYSVDATTAAALSSTKKPTSSTIVRTVMMGTK